MTEAAPNLEFWHWFQTLHPDHQLNLVGAFIGLVLGILVIIGFLINAFHRRRVEFGLKRELLERGMSADEIATVIRATPGKGKAIGHKNQPTRGQ
ncbi:MAG: hypothetical protein L0228_08575 [Planctomycetes bacterium]|nr:hypothetical protein [Planctomycetota bacterium]